jgi:hypothetical protein
MTENTIELLEDKRKTILVIYYEAINKKKLLITNAKLVIATENVFLND